MIQVRVDGDPVSAIALPTDQDASGRSFGAEELDALRDVIDSGTLTEHEGHAGSRASRRGSPTLLGVEHVVACASGTAAVHVAVAGVDPEPGDEIITTSITDMGALAPDPLPGRHPGLRRRRPRHR